MHRGYVEVVTVDAFTTERGKGNPAGVVNNAENLTDEQMLDIAKKLGYNETVFIMDSEVADFKLRYFTPGHETPLCGHATIGALKYVTQNKEYPLQVLVETMNAILTIKVLKNGDIVMEQEQPKFVLFEGNTEGLCGLLNIDICDLHSELPIQYGFTGSWTLLIPVKDQSVLAKMKPKTKWFPKILTKMPRSSIHPFCIESKSDKIFDARHFSSPYSKTVEDSVTGTASGVMVAYLHKNMYIDEKCITISIKQGKYVNRAGSLKACSKKTSNNYYITVTGKAVIGSTMLVSI